MEVRIVTIESPDGGGAIMPAGQWVVKTASSAGEAARLEREATQLRRAAHPGVVELGPCGGIELRTRYAGRSWRVLGDRPAAELCGLGAAVATVIADLHDLGIVHGAIDADHILIGADGRPVLCGFASSTSTDDGDPAGDVRDLMATLSDGLGPDAPGRLTMVLRPGGSRRAGPAGRRRRPGRSVPTARALAASLGTAMADRRLPLPARPDDRGPSSPPADVVANPTGGDATVTPDGSTGSSPPSGHRSKDRHDAPPGTRPRQRRRRVGTVTVVAAVAVVVAGGAVLLRQDVSPPPAGRPAACPSTDHGCRPILVHDGAFATAAGRYDIAMADPVVVLGRWACGATSLPAALDPRTGQVWAWLRWAGPTRPVAATAIRTAPGATTLLVVPEASGCDRLQIVGRAGRSTVVLPGEGRDA